MYIEIFRQNCHFCSAKILIYTESSNFSMNYFSNLAVFFIFNNVIFSYITLTLSKLTNIFGDEERLDTEKVLLAVGSVINELSQNCTASVTYLANFAQRMAGVGTQGEDDYSGNNGICCGACFGLMIWIIYPAPQGQNIPKADFMQGFIQV